MNGIVVTIIVMFMMMWGCATCITSSSRTVNQPVNETNVTVIGGPASEGLDLKAVGELVKTVKSAEEFEKELNKDGGVNNLDLNNDNTTDFISVTEYGNQKDQFGFSLTTEPEKGEVQEVANIEIIKGEKEAQVQVSGNEQIYGSGHHYSYSHSSPGTWLLMGYLLGNHSFYRPSWGYGYYPSYYRSYSTRPYDRYRSSMSSYTSNSSYRRVSSLPRQTSIANPNAGKSASKGITRSLAKPSAAQKSFQARAATKPTRSGGFGRPASSSSSSSVRNRSSSRGFGGRGK